jgi:hypothetical protein
LIGICGPGAGLWGIRLAPMMPQMSPRNLR